MHPCLHPIRKLEACLLLTQMVKGHETPGWRKTPSCSQCGRASHSVVRFCFYLWPLYNPAVPLSAAQRQLRRPLDHLSAQSFLPLCKFPTTDFTIAPYGVVCSTFHSQSSFSVRRILFNSSTSQHLAWRDLPLSSQESLAAPMASGVPLPALGSQLSCLDLSSTHFGTRS